MFLCIHINLFYALAGRIFSTHETENNVKDGISGKDSNLIPCFWDSNRNPELCRYEQLRRSSVAWYIVNAIAQQIFHQLFPYTPMIIVASMVFWGSLGLFTYLVIKAMAV